MAALTETQGNAREMDGTHGELIRKRLRRHTGNPRRMHKENRREPTRTHGVRCQPRAGCWPSLYYRVRVIVVIWVRILAVMSPYTTWLNVNLVLRAFSALQNGGRTTIL